jgi:RNA polymerase sigma-70 factor (ECF subfamily)
VLITDGGGKRKAALRPSRGADKVTRFLLAVSGEGTDELSLATVNGEVA